MRFCNSILVYAGTLLASSIFINSVYSQQSSFDITLLDEHEYIEGRVFVKFRDGVDAVTKNSIRHSLNAERLMKFEFIGSELWKLSGLSVRDAILLYDGHPDIDHIEPEWRIYLIEPISMIPADEPDFMESGQAFPDDPMFEDLWGLRNTGQSGGTEGADIDATYTWEFHTGGDIIAAIFDTGIQYTHPDLEENIWDGIGWDFADWNPNPWDFHGHGTHVAGTVAAVGNNGIGVTGVAWEADLMGVKIFRNNESFGGISGVVSGFEYAIEHGAKISNHSWGGGGFSADLYNAILAARDAGHLVIAAAGNNNSNNDNNPFYPCNYDSDNMICVASSSHLDARSWYSNYGKETVHLAAPGGTGGQGTGLILSTHLNEGYAWFQGTSMASPHVAGAAALLWSRYPDWTYLEIKERLLSTVDQLSAWEDLVITGGRLNVFRALYPPQVELAYPPDGETAEADETAMSLYLSWYNTEPSVDSFTLQISLEDYFENVIYEGTGISDTTYSFSEVEEGITYYWRVKGEGEQDTGPWSEVWSFTVLLTDLPEHESIPVYYTLEKNYPNPFNPSTVIRYGLPERSVVNLTIYNTLGQRVATLINGEIDPGYHEVEWHSERLSSGVYFYRMDAVSVENPANRYLNVRSMVLVK